jgi:sugar phosphate isomerase/epimerase
MIERGNLMLVGAMNSPMRDLATEIRAIQRDGFDFVDITLEPAGARSDQIDVPGVRAALAETGLRATGHTAYYLPIASPFPELREVALREIERCIDVLAALGVPNVDVHPDPRMPLHEPEAIVERNTESLQRLAKYAESHGLQLMLENLGGLFGSPDVLGRVFDAVPSLGLLLDVGHANLSVPRNNADAILARIGHRLAHVHFSDNRGGEQDLHLPIGAGRINWDGVISLLKSRGYDGTITLEVFSADRDYLRLSAAKVRKLWSR